MPLGWANAPPGISNIVANATDAATFNTEAQDLNAKAPRRRATESFNAEARRKQTQRRKGAKAQS
jgi:hypothetical protein